MAFTAQTEDKESLQALAFALRQEKGSEIEYAEVESAMQDYMAVDAKVRDCCGIEEAKLYPRFRIWVTDGKPGDVEGWINSSVWIANAVIKSAYIRGTDYIFYNTIGDQKFRGAYREIAKHIAKNAKDSRVRTVYGQMSKGTGDKWKPADVIAIKKSKAAQFIRVMESYKNLRPDLSEFKEAKKLDEMNKDLKKGVGSSKKQLEVVEDMQMLYWYNQWVDKKYKSRECVPISLKKVSATAKVLLKVKTPLVAMKSFDHKEARGVKNAIKLDVEIGKVDFSPRNAKCIVNFKLSGVKGHKMDIRGFQSAINNDVQMQLQKGSAANHGKATLSIFGLITKLSGGRMALSKQRAELRKLFKGKRIPTGKDHQFTNYSIFQDYAEQQRGDFNKSNWKEDLPNWAKYLNFLSGKKHKVKDVLAKCNALYDQKPVSAAKWLKNKVQSYEVGQVVDMAQPQIKDMIKTNIMKSIYSQAASQGFRIFGENKITDYMTASSYLKVGG